VVVYARTAEGDPIAGLVATAIEGALDAPRYGGEEAGAWDGAETGSTGSILLVGVPEGEAVVEVAGGDLAGSVTVPVAAGTLSFAILTL
jgi:hypothetical protein